MAIQRPIKNKWLGARVDEGLDERVSDYITVADMSMGDLIRKSVNEYMANHPIRRASPAQTELLKPGE